MLEHILIPLDGSDLAEAAIEPAKQLLQPNGKITLVMAIDKLLSWGYGLPTSSVLDESSKTTDELMRNTKTYLYQIAARLYDAGFKVETLILFGEAAPVIVEIAASHKVGAIAMSTHGRSGLSRLLFGSVTGKVLSTAPCPVFVIPNRRPTVEIEAESDNVAYS
jgi:nucleotide-binding universal stress UspA family protein